MNDPFSVLGVSSSATEDEIKSAYRRLAKKYHPDLNPGDKAAEQKMKEINEAYTQALQIKKNGGTWNPYGSSGSSGSSGSPYGNSWGPYGNPFGNQSGPYGNRTEYRDPYSGQNGASGNPFGDFGFDPFSAFFGGRAASSGPQARSYANPDLDEVARVLRAGRHSEAEQLLNRIPSHDADWHALYARAESALGNRISALDHARAAARMAPGDPEYRQLLSEIESGSRAYRRTRSGGGYDFQSLICQNPCITCIAVNMLINCCCGRAFWC